MTPLAAAVDRLSFSASALLILLGAFVIGALLVTGTELRRPRADIAVRGLAGGLMSALVAGVFASTAADTAPAVPSAGGALAQTGTDSGPPSTATASASPGAAAPGSSAAPGSAGGLPAGSVAAAGTSGSAAGAGSTKAGAGAGGGPRTPNPAAALPPLEVGYIGVNPNDKEVQAEGSAGVVPPAPDPYQYAHSIQTYINAHGGIGGRTVDIKVVERNPSSTDPNQENALCSQLTEGEHVFMAIGSDGGPEQCYANARTPFLCDCPEVGSDLQKYAPYIWQPGGVFAEAEYAALVQGLGEQGFFADGTKLGIIVDDTPAEHDLLDQRLRPIIQRFHSYASSDIETYNVKDAQSPADYGSLGADLQQAEIQFNKDGVNRIFFLYDGDLVPEDFMNDAQAQQYHPVYGLHSSNHPYLTLQKAVPAAQLHNAVGIGTVEAADVDAAHSDPYPTGQGEQLCRDALGADGSPPQTRLESAFQLPLCDGMFMLQAAATGLAPNFTAEQWAASAQHLGRRFQSAEALPGTTNFVPNRYSGTAAYRWLHYVDGCAGDPDADANGGGCFQYNGTTPHSMPY